MVKTSALQFLAGAGLDLNRVFQQGVRYSTMAQLARRQQAAAARQRQSKRNNKHRRTGQRARTASACSSGSHGKTGSSSDAASAAATTGPGVAGSAGEVAQPGVGVGAGAGAVAGGAVSDGGTADTATGATAAAGAAGQPEATAAEPPASLHTLWARLSAARKPLVVHNGWLDLVFLYDAFGGELPRQLSTFVSRIVVRRPLEEHPLPRCILSGPQWQTPA